MRTETYEGKPCAAGHTTRYRSNRKCVQCSKVPTVYITLTAGLDPRSLPGLPPPWVRSESDARQVKGMMFSVHRELDSATANAKKLGGEVWRATRIDTS